MKKIANKEVIGQHKIII